MGADDFGDLSRPSGARGAGPLAEEISAALEEPPGDVVLEAEDDEMGWIVRDGVRLSRVNFQAVGGADAQLEAEAIPSADLELEDGDVVALGDRSFRVVHTPGHRPGAICLFDERHRLLVSGDSVCGERRDLIRMGNEVYVGSLRRLLRLESYLMIMSHPFMPAGRNILRGQEIPEMISASIRIAEQL